MVLAMVATTEIRDGLIERLNGALGRLHMKIDTLTNVDTDRAERLRLRAKRLAVQSAIEAIVNGISTDNVEQFKAVQLEMFQNHKAVTEKDYDAQNEGYRGGYSLVIDYMRYSIGCLEDH